MIKKLTYILILSIFCANFTFAQTQTANLQYNTFKYSFKPGDEVKFLKNANTNMVLFEKSQTIENKVFYLQEAMRYYYLLSQIKPDSIDAYVGLGRIYDELRIDNHARENFFKALNFNNKSPRTNYYFANYYFKRDELITALSYYQKAYNLGYSQSYYLNYRLGLIYEKLADIETSKKFYSNANRLNPSNSELENKIRLLDELNYANSQYYLFNETGKRKKRDK